MRKRDTGRRPRKTAGEDPKRTPEETGLPGVGEVDRGRKTDRSVLEGERGSRAAAVGKRQRVPRIGPAVAHEDGAHGPARSDREAQRGAKPEHLDTRGAAGGRRETVLVDETAVLEQQIGPQPRGEAPAGAGGETNSSRPGGPGSTDCENRRSSRSSASPASPGSKSAARPDRSARAGAELAELSVVVGTHLMRPADADAPLDAQAPYGLRQFLGAGATRSSSVNAMWSTEQRLRDVKHAGPWSALWSAPAWI